jgi:putative CocE/NonD family hydrolase
MKRYLLAALLLAIPAHAQVAGETSETPAVFHPKTGSFDYERRDVMIPMRDDIKLHTVILIPRSAQNAPILLTRTPYNATELTTYNHSGHLISALDGYDNADDIIVASGYIRVIQDVRGKYGSEGDFYMNRPPIGPLNATKTDESTDTYDTIDWLIKNVPSNNGNVGTIGISYDGWTTLISLMNPHPALKVAVPMNPMVDGWMGDDWFHNGAFRQLNLDYIYEQEATRANDLKWWNDHFDDYDSFLEAGDANDLAVSRGVDQLGFYRKLTEHPNYDEFWREQAMDRLLSAQKLTVPTMLVHSLWDQEDIYAAPAVWNALKPKDTEGKLYLTLGPWHHGQEIDNDIGLGAVGFGSDTGLFFRWHILKPFLDMYLKGGPLTSIATVNAFETGTNRWLRLGDWPQGCDHGCDIAQKPIFMQPGSALGFDKPADGEVGSYVSDPNKPVPFIQRPIHLLADDESLPWRNWLASDQREASTRPDVLTYRTARLTEPVKISGQPIASLIATTTGTDGDFVVKVIDQYPDEVAQQPELGGYQLMVSADILRGRFRDSAEHPSAIPAGAKQIYRFTLPTVNHVFLPGHRIMVQVQSTWFPVYDRNPQTFVPNIFFAKKEDYRLATIKLLAGSEVVLPVVTGQNRNGP